MVVLQPTHRAPSSFCPSCGSWATFQLLQHTRRGSCNNLPPALFDNNSILWPSPSASYTVLPQTHTAVYIPSRATHALRLRDVHQPQTSTSYPLHKEVHHVFHLYGWRSFCHLLTFLLQSLISFDTLAIPTCTSMTFSLFFAFPICLIDSSLSKCSPEFVSPLLPKDVSPLKLFYFKTSPYSCQIPLLWLTVMISFFNFSNFALK